MRNNEEKDIHEEVVSGLETTVGSFAARLQQKLSQKATEEDNELAQKRLRQSILLQGLKSIRKAFQETCRITLGNRFKLELHVDDFEGWPRLRLVLEDLQNEAPSEHALIVTAFNRSNQAGIDFRDVSNRSRGRVLLDEDNKLSRLPLTLKKQVRDFLDEVAEYVLNPKASKKAVRQAIPGGAEQVETPVLENNELADTDLFMESSLVGNKNLVATQDSNSDELLEGNFHMSDSTTNDANVLPVQKAAAPVKQAVPRKTEKKTDLSGLTDISFDS